MVFGLHLKILQKVNDALIIIKKHIFVLNKYYIYY